MPSREWAPLQRERNVVAYRLSKAVIDACPSAPSANAVKLMSPPVCVSGVLFPVRLAPPTPGGVAVKVTVEAPVFVSVAKALVFAPVKFAKQGAAEPHSVELLLIAAVMFSAVRS